MRQILTVSLLSCFALAYCGSGGGGGASAGGSGFSTPGTNNQGVAKWAKTVTTGPDISWFTHAATDSSGNVYVVGYQNKNGVFDWGDGVTTQGTSASGKNFLLMKYNASGTPQWARTVTAGSDVSEASGVAIDSSGNVYTVGYQTGNGVYSYASGVDAQGTAIGKRNAVLIKYDSSGTALWAKTVTAGSDDSSFSKVVIDNSGNIYVSGYQRGAGAYTYATSVTATGTSAGTNALLVKYDNAGTALWAKTVTAGSDPSNFGGLAVDSSGNIYATGFIDKNNTFTFGPAVVARGAFGGGGNGDHNPVLVKYNGDGDALWATTPSFVADSSEFITVTTDSSGNVYTGGYQFSHNWVTYGPGVSAKGTAGSGAFSVVLVKYSSAGYAQWARTPKVGASFGLYANVTTDSSGNVYAVGTQYGSTTYEYSDTVTATAPFAGSDNGILVKYNSSGDAQWAKTATTGSARSSFNGLTIDSAGKIYVAASQSGQSTFTYGTGVDATAAAGSTGFNSLLLKYE